MPAAILADPPAAVGLDQIEAAGSGRLLLRSGDLRVPCRIRHSARARKLRIQIDADGRVLLVIPARVAPAVARQFLRTHAEWVVKQHLLALRRRGTQEPVANFVDGAAVPFRGGHLTLNLQVGPAAVARLGDRIVVHASGPGNAGVTTARRQLLGWYRQQARSGFGASVARWSRVTGLVPGGIRVCNQRARWGSCGVRGVLNLNWRLILAPPAALDYVVLHEVCHLRHRDHSPRFWALVDSYMTDHRHQRDWLRCHGAGLMGFLADR